MLGRNKNKTPKPNSNWRSAGRWLVRAVVVGLAAAGVRKARNAGVTPQKVTGAVTNGVQTVKNKVTPAKADPGKAKDADTEVTTSTPTTDKAKATGTNPDKKSGGKDGEATIGGTPGLNQGTPGAL